MAVAQVAGRQEEEEVVSTQVARLREELLLARVSFFPLT